MTKPIKNPNQLIRWSVYAVSGVIGLVLVWFIVTDSFDGLLGGMFTKKEKNPMPVALASTVSQSTQDQANHGYESKPEPKQEAPQVEAVPATPDPQMAQVLEALNRLGASMDRMGTSMLGMNANIEMMMKSQGKPKQGTPVKEKSKEETEAEREAKRKQAKQEYKERIEEAKGYKSTSIDVEPPKTSTGKLRRLSTPYSLLPGTKINFATEAKVSNEAAGEFLAYVTEPVMDSVTHTMVVIPPMSWFIMRISKQAIFGDDRLTVEAKTLVFPPNGVEGKWIELENAMAGDRAGTPGFADQIDRHGWRILGGVAMKTAIQLGSSTANVMSSGASGIAGNVTGHAVGEGMQQVQQFMRTDPSFIVRHGYMGTLYLGHELVITEPYES